jgi:hypothetical protein
MEDPASRTVSRSWPRAAVAIALVVASATAGCAGLHKGPRLLAGVGAVAVAGGSGLWATGEGLSGGGHDSASHPMINAGFVTVVVGLAAIVAAGGWMAVSVVCEADPDCPEEEQCREVPAPPGGIPYKQCIPR